MIETTLYVAINFYWLQRRVGKHERIVCDLQKLKQRKRSFYRNIALKIYNDFIKWNICCFTHGSTCPMRIFSPVEYKIKNQVRFLTIFVDAIAACIQQTLLIHIANSFKSIRGFFYREKSQLQLYSLKCIEVVLGSFSIQLRHKVSTPAHSIFLCCFIHALAAVHGQKLAFIHTMN